MNRAPMNLQGWCRGNSVGGWAPTILWLVGGYVPIGAHRPMNAHPVLLRPLQFYVVMLGGPLWEHNGSPTILTPLRAGPRPILWWRKIKE